MLDDSGDDDDEIFSPSDRFDASVWRKSRVDENASRMSNRTDFRPNLDQSGNVSARCAVDAEKHGTHNEELMMFMKGLKKIVQNITAVRTYLEQETDHDPKMLQLLQDQCSLRRFPVPLQEAQRVYQSLLKTCLDILQARKEGYLQQVKRMKDSASIATRNAVQIERATTLQKFASYRADQQAQQGQSAALFQERLDASERALAQLQQRHRDLEEAHERAITDKKHVERHVADLIKEAVQEKDHEWAQQLARKEQQLLDLMREAKESQREDAGAWERRVQARCDEVRALEEVRRQQVAQEKDLLAAEVERLQQELRRKADEMTAQQDLHRKHAEELRDRYEGLMQSASAEATKAVVLMREEQQVHQQGLERERTKLRADFEKQMSKFREDMYMKQALELETLRERLQAEARRKQTELDVHYQEQIHKVKTLHEQELGRHLREADRLRRILHTQQAGQVAITSSSSGAAAMMSSAATFGTLGSSGGSPVMRAQFTKSSGRYGRTEASGAGTHEVIPPPPGPPPDSTILDEALFTATSKQPYSVAGNSRRVSGYLKELEKYLQTQPDTAPGPSTSRPFAADTKAGKSDTAVMTSSDSERSEDSMTRPMRDDSTLHDLGRGFSSSIQNPPIDNHAADDDDDDDDDALLMDDFAFNISQASR